MTDAEIKSQKKKEYFIAYRKKNRELLRIKNAEYNKRTGPRILSEEQKKVRDIRFKKWKMDNKERKKQYDREYNLMKNFNLSIDEYNKILDGQNGCCAICKTPQSELTRELSVDHNHDTGEIRGLLCSNCNRGIGHLKDDITILQSAISYLSIKKR